MTTEKMKTVSGNCLLHQYRWDTGGPDVDKRIVLRHLKSRRLHLLLLVQPRAVVAFESGERRPGSQALEVLSPEVGDHILQVGELLVPGFG